MTVHPLPGGGGNSLAGAIRAAAPKPPGITAIGGQGSAVAAKHVVHGDGSSGVDDGAHGTHDYGEMHVQVMEHIHAHGSKLAQHDARITRLEAGKDVKLGSPNH